ncbi:addiction module toxin, RelE/StbE family [Granulicella tundricola MP5ACTX9]|uniref:Addiction module toxin, RelE/StbE family n=1 Tax=Granulicella tundricola (strain ATCC BAA-1859 / DSM 23138 / MP5ACTX9) TaxID=1198114 RepID=E8X233_GRATM|nr:addiction module toxin, RelE/StbE family [Granulicella tundricola MP5ACTX9]
MAWLIELDEDAERDLARLDKSVQRTIIKYLRTRIAPAADVRDFGKPLGHALSGLWSYRVGDYRILCNIEQDRLTVLVVGIGHRKDVYKT